jgi:hypothetical protein
MLEQPQDCIFDKTLEIKLVELDSDAVVLRFPADTRAGIPSDYTEAYEPRAET